MKTPLRIAHLTDIHIGPGDAPISRIAVRHNFRRVLATLAALPPDLLVISGDLAAHAGELDAYQWIAAQLQDLNWPYVVMMGNHDRLATLRQAFPLNATEIREERYYFRRDLQGHRLLFLDSGPYQVNPAQLDWLHAECASYPDEILLFIHHPPLPCGCTFMDSRHGLQNSAEVWQILRNLPNIRHIFCGHYHTERTLVRDGKVLYLTPSTMMQIDTHSPGFAIEHLQPGWRIIEWDGTTLCSHVHYLPSAETQTHPA